MKLKEESQRRKEWLSVPLGLLVLLILLAWALFAPGLSERPSSTAACWPSPASH